MVQRDCFYRHLLMHADQFDAIEIVPHFPPLPGMCYIHPPMPETDGTYFDKLVTRFSPMTPEDEILIRPFFLSLFWGGNPGSQPAWLITAPPMEMNRAGTVSAKSKLAEMTSLLVGGMIKVSPREDIVQIRKRLLSAGAAPQAADSNRQHQAS